MNNQMKRVALLVSFGAILALVTTDASALGRHSKSGRSSFAQTSSDSVSNGSGSVVINDDNGGRPVDLPNGDSNPVPEPASLVLLGSALAGLGGYRGLRKRLARG